MPFDTVFSWIIKKRIEQIQFFTNNPIQSQKDVFIELIKKAQNTSFGLKHDFKSIKTLNDFKSKVPLHTYEDLFPYIEQSIKGEKDVLWPGKMQWFSKSSGTTNSKSKLIPVSKEAIQDCHYKGGKDLLSIYYHNNPNAKLFTGKHLILGGNTSVNKLSESSSFGDLSAIIVKNLPFWCEIRRTPNKKITLMDNWDEKIEKMAKACLNEDVRILAGVPSWMLVLLNEVMNITNKKSIAEIWPNLQLYMHGGVNFDPYQNQFKNIIKSHTLNYYQTFNASEGFFSLQNQNKANDMLLMLDYGIYYEFIPMDSFNGIDSKTISLEDVEVDKNYGLVISTNAGLWRYIIGDTIKFTNLNPFKIRVSGRTQHYINAFGEELIIDNTDKAIAIAMQKTNSTVIEYTVAPIYLKGNKSGAHQWLIEFKESPNDINLFASFLDEALKMLNSDYESKRSYDIILNKPQITTVTKNTFYNWLETKGKLGGQNKIPRLQNNRDFIEELISKFN